MQISISNCFLVTESYVDFISFLIQAFMDGKTNSNLCLGKHKNAQITWDNYLGSPIFKYVFYSRELYTLGKG